MLYTVVNFILTSLSSPAKAIVIDLSAITNQSEFSFQRTEFEKILETVKKEWKDSAQTIPDIYEAMKKSQKSID